jgi:hypothetical protein
MAGVAVGVALCIHELGYLANVFLYHLGSRGKEVLPYAPVIDLHLPEVIEALRLWLG